MKDTEELSGFIRLKLQVLVVFSGCPLLVLHQLIIELLYFILVNAAQVRFRLHILLQGAAVSVLSYYII